MSGMKDILDEMENEDREAEQEAVRRIDTSGVEVVEMSRKVIAQAEQGSITAILQLLNESLVTQEVRTRAVLEGRILHLLCEAPKAELLDADLLVPSIQQLLETIAPPNFHTVQIYSRTRREHQSLWLQEIRQGNHPHLLWSKRVPLKQPNPLHRLLRSWQGLMAQRTRFNLQQDWTRADRQRQRFSRATLAGLAVGGTGVIILAGIGLWRLGSRLTLTIETTPLNSAPSPVASATPVASPSLTPMPIAEPQPDPFVQAVRLAEKSSTEGKVARSRGEWLALASQWQQASDWMAEVPDSDPRYPTAQNRVLLYRQNSEAALAEADRVETEKN
ncbi:MAG: hypothetical protein ACO4AI_04440 [Prochlorothrix sp.]